MARVHPSGDLPVGWLWVRLRLLPELPACISPFAARGKAHASGHSQMGGSEGIGCALVRVQVKKGFNQRRKMLRNSLQGLHSGGKV
jgi:hypothetical protein